MKFTKEDARKELTAQMTANKEKLSLSERSINEQLDALMPLIATDETELADFITQVMPLFKTANANIRNDVSAGIKEYKDQNPIQPQTPPAKPTEPQPTESEWERRLKALEEENATIKREKAISDKRKQIKNALKEKGVKDNEWINRMLDLVTITEDTDVTGSTESYLALYNQQAAELPSDITPKGAGGHQVDRASETIKAAAEIAKQQRLVG